MADRKDFETIAMVHLDSVYRAAAALCGRSGQADDLVQATFLKALEQFDTFRQGTNCRAWLLRILRNHWIDLLRRAKVAGPPVPLEDRLLAAPPEAEAEPAGLEDVLERFSDEQVVAALRLLPDDQRWALLLTDVEGLSTAEAAGVLDVPPGTVKSRAWRARQRLRELLMERARELGFLGRR